MSSRTTSVTHQLRLSTSAPSSTSLRGAASNSAVSAITNMSGQVSSPTASRTTSQDLYVPAQVSCVSDTRPAPSLVTTCETSCPSDRYVLNCSGIHHFAPVSRSGIASDYCPDGWTYRRQRGYMMDERDCCRCGHVSVEPTVCRADCPCWNRNSVSGTDRTCELEFHITDLWMGTNDDHGDVGASVLRRFPQCTCSH